MRVEVIYALNLKPGDLWAGTVDRSAPTRPCQPFARAHEVREVTPYPGGEGERMIRVAGPNGDLEPVREAMQVMVIRP